MPKTSLKAKQQQIRSLIQNFAWETDPKWEPKLGKIKSEIQDYWSNYLKR